MPRVLLIYPLSWRPVETFGDKLERLSERYSGTLITSASSFKTFQVSRFKIVVVKRSWKLFRMLRAISGQYELVVTYDPLASGIVGLIVKWLTGAKLICEVNGDYNNPANYSEVRSKLLARIKRSLYVAVQRFVLKRADGVKLLYPGQVDISGLTRSFPDEVKTDRFHAIEDGRYILSVGHPWYVKGFDVLIQAFKQIADDIPGWRLKILGWIPDPDRLQSLIDNHPRIELLKPIPHTDMPQLMGKCGFFVLPSRTEAMGRVLVEAMASGKPRIGTTVGGIPTVIEHGTDGLLVPPEDVSALSEAMLRLAKDDELRERMGKRAGQRAGSEFTQDRYYERLTGFWEEVLSECA